MVPLCDYHMHTPLCGHATGNPEDYAQQAIACGLREIGFSDHAPLVSHEDPSVTMSFDQLPEYQRMIEDVQDKFEGKLSIKLGIEADFISGCEDKTQAILDGYEYDYVYGSVHFIKDWAFDNPEEIDGWEHSETNQIYQQYYETLRASAQTKMYDIIAHVDLVKKFGHRPSMDFKEEIEKTAEAFKSAGVAIEINTSGLRKPVKEIYPDLETLKIYARAGIPVTFGSDAHQPQQVGQDFDKAYQLAQAAGYKEFITFRKRQIEEVVKL